MKVLKKMEAQRGEEVIALIAAYLSKLQLILKIKYHDYSFYLSQTGLGLEKCFTVYAATAIYQMSRMHLAKGDNSSEAERTNRK